MKRKIFTTVKPEEKVMNGSVDPNVVLLLNVKRVKVGIKTTEGCATIVLSMFLCQQEAMPRIKPGRKFVPMMVASNPMPILGTQGQG